MRAKLASATSSADLQAVIKEIEAISERIDRSSVESG